MDENKKLREGFNAGYVLERYKPELSRRLQDSLAERDDPYAKGFISGSRQYVQDSLSRGANERKDDAEDLYIAPQDKERRHEREDKNSGIER